MRRYYLLLAVVLFPVCLKSQDIVLDDCVRESLKNNPLAANKELAVKIAEVKKNIIKSAWLPGIDLNGQATWQSDVVALDLNLPFPVDFPKIPKDQYRITTDLTQMIYDGGSIKNQQVIENINADIAVKELEISESELTQTVEDLFFAILVTEKRIEVMNLMEESVNKTIVQVQSGVKNGLLSDSDLPIILAERIKVEQQQISLRGLKQRAVAALGVLMGQELKPGSRFQIPGSIDVNALSGERPEFKLFDLQGTMLDARKNLLSSQLKPRVMAFGQAGYGKPGLNFLGNKWDPYLMLGLKGTWNVWDWGRVRRQKETLMVNQVVIENQKKSFGLQVSLAEQRQQLQIDEIRSLITKDQELLDNRVKITMAFNSRLANGLITTSQYITEWTKEQEARINSEVRKIELISSEYKLLSIKGKR